MKKSNFSFNLLMALLAFTGTIFLLFLSFIKSFGQNSTSIWAWLIPIYLIVVITLWVILLKKRKKQSNE